LISKLSIFFADISNLIKLQAAQFKVKYLQSKPKDKKLAEYFLWMQP